MGRFSLIVFLVLARPALENRPRESHYRDARNDGAEGVAAAPTCASALSSSGLNAALATRNIFKDWSGSFHARSLTTDDFLRAFSHYLDSLGKQTREDPQSSMACLYCHAPLLKHSRPGNHSPGNRLRPAKKREGSMVLKSAASPVTSAGNRVFSGPIDKPAGQSLSCFERFRPSYKEASFCGNCHTWIFHCPLLRRLQRLDRKAGQQDRARTCQSCHMREQAASPVREDRGERSTATLFPADARWRCFSRR